jgi:aspartate 1-decarboxylase
MQTQVVLSTALTNHLNKVRVLLMKASEDYIFNVKCANSSFGYYELIALDTSSYEGKTLKKAAIDIVEIPNPGERETLMASISAYYQLVQSKANAAGKISKSDMVAILNQLYSSEARIAA